MYLVLIDTRIRDIESITDSFTENTEYVLFDFYVDTYDTIQTNILNKRANPGAVLHYESVAIIQHNYDYSVYRLILNSTNAIIDSLETEDPGIDTWKQYLDFLRWITGVLGATYIDLLACDLWANPNWRYMIETVRPELYIRASLDKTGEGGNFVLESDNVDMIGVYFTDAILQYKYAFFSQPYPNPVYGFTNYSTYKLPLTNLASKNDTFNSMFTSVYMINPTFSNVVSVFSNNASNAVLLSNGTLSLYGTTSTSGAAMPSGIVTQSQLVNITKVVGSTDSFCALKTDGTIICWGLPNLGSGALDINTISSVDFINVNTVRNDLVNVVDIFATAQTSFAALTSAGNVITWGKKIYGGDPSTVASQLSSGVVSIRSGYNYFVAIKSNGTAVWWGGNAGGYVSTTYFPNSKPIIDAVIATWSAFGLFIRLNGSATEIVTYNGNLIYTVPTGVIILRKQLYGAGYTDKYFFVLSNSTIVYISNNIATVLASTTDVAVTEDAYALITNGTVVAFGTARFGGSLTDINDGLWSGATVTNAVRLVSTGGSIGVIKSDNTFVWWGRPGPIYPNRSFPTSFPTAFARLTTNIATVYQGSSNYVVVQRNGGIASTRSTVNFSTKSANTNIYFEVLGDANVGFVPLIIPFAPTVTPSTIPQNTSTQVSYYVSNPDLMAYCGRTYRLYDGSAGISTFYPLIDTPTYVFSTNTPYVGERTLTIKDETNTVYTVTSFAMTVIPSGFSFTYTPIDLYSPTGIFDLSYTDQYNQIFSANTTYSLKDANTNTLGNATVDASSSTIFFQNASSATLQYGPNTLQIYASSTIIGSPITINAVCFLEGTRILCFDKRSSTTKYIPVEKLRPGTLVKTLNAGFVPIKLIGHSTLVNSDSETRMRDALYKCSKSHYPEITNDLYITGNHSVLVRELSEKQHAELTRNCGGVYLTEGQYRLPAWLDMRAQRFRESGVFRIWHFALENNDYYMNYGVYANGLLVETTSLRFMNELSGMSLVD